MERGRRRVHTLPLPKMTEKHPNENRKPETGKASPGFGQPALAASSLSSAPSGRPRLSGPQLSFLLRVTPPALQSEREHEIPACVTIAQAILESATPQFGWGSSSLFRLANNPFGIECSHPPTASIPSTPSTGPQAEEAEELKEANEDSGSVEASTWEVVNGVKEQAPAQFQRFPSLTEAFRAHARLLRSPRYRRAYEARHDWKQFAEKLGPKRSEHDPDHCGYSTNPSYSALLASLVRVYRLDDPRLLEWLESGIDPGPALSLQQSAAR
jgi:flagellar protein FlgJ